MSLPLNLHLIEGSVGREIAGRRKDLDRIREFRGATRAGGSAGQPPLCKHVAGSSRTRRGVAQRRLRWTEFLRRAIWGYSLMISQHAGRRITEKQRARWVKMLCQSAEDAMVPNDPEFRAAFVAYLKWGSRIGREKSQQNATPPLNLRPMQEALSGGPSAQSIAPLPSHGLLPGALPILVSG